MEDIQEKDVVWTTCPPIPEGTKPLDHQVAGHVFGRLNGHKKNQLGFLQDDSGCILKPVQGGSKGLREVRFYEFISEESEDEISYKNSISKYLNTECQLSSIESSSIFITEEVCTNIRKLRDFVPKYHGLWTTPLHPGVSYLKLENVTRPFNVPCVMDVKVGCITYDKFADEGKQRRELSKCPALNELRFQLIGLKVFSSKNNGYDVLERTFLRALNPSNILDEGLSLFFHSSSKPGQVILEIFLSRLQSILHWFEGQKTLVFIASSLLFVYDASLLNHGVNADGECNDGGNVNNKENSLCDHASFIERMVELRMIDFTHVFPSGNRVDMNYLEGLQSLISYIKQLKK